MKKVFHLILMLVAATVLQSCCWNGDCDETDDFPVTLVESQFEPVYMPRPEFENSVELGPAQVVINSGKIYVIGSYLFINEKNKGFHVFNNEDPSNPTSLYFITSPGATDLAIRENVLFINQATDLIAVAIDFTTGGLTVSKRIKNTFPIMLSPDGFYPENLPVDNVVINWIPKIVTP